MAPPVSYTKATLSYPIYSVDFDPYNRGYLVVGGGGGAGNNGVRNKITLLDVTSRSTLDVAAEIELPKDEDSVTSLANLASKDGLITLAGINSTDADQKAGKNEHLRTFGIQYPKRKRQVETVTEKDEGDDQGQIAVLGKAALFKPATGPKPETYQRLLRLSPARRSESGSRRIGAVTTGLAKQSEVVIFDATRTPPGSAEIINRIEVQSEVADLDICEPFQSTFSIAWCTDYDVFEQTVEYNFANKVKELTPKGPRRVHSVSNVDGSGKTITRPKYRSLRFLTDHHVLVLSNLPNKSGSELSIMHLYPTGPAAVLFHKILPSRIKQGVGLAVCALDSDKDGSRQFVVSCAAQDTSIEVYTINYVRPTDTFTTFRSFTTLRDVHPQSMTAITLSSFHPPPRANEDKTEEGSATSTSSVAQQPQYIRLASTSMGNTVVVDTFALTPLDPKSKTTRYVLSHPSDEKWTQRAYIILISFIVVMAAIVLQSLLAPEATKGMTSFLPPGARQYINNPVNAAQDAKSGASSAVSSAIPEIKTPKTIKDMLRSLGAKDSTKALVLRSAPDQSTDLSMDVVADREEFLKRETAARHWDELDEHEKHAWREALVKAGHWAAGEGETVFKGVLFSSYAGFVGQAAAQAMN